MNIAESFIDLAKQEGGKYKSSNKSYLGRGLSSAPVSKHLLDLEYNNHLISIIYEFGNHNLGSIVCVFSNEIKIPDFYFRFVSHYRRLFNKKLNVLNVISDDKSFVKFLERQIDILGIEAIAKRSRFKPKVLIDRESNKVIFLYHLEFSDKMLVVRPLISLFKALIDFDES